MMLLPLLLLAAQPAQAEPPPASPPVPQKFSILTPTQNCEKQRNEAGEDVVVCADVPLPPPIPYPDEAYGPRPSNPFRTGTGALLAENAPCAATLRGCLVGFGPPIMPIVKGVAGVVGRTFAKKPDKSGRVAITLDDSGAPTGRIEP